MDLADDIDSLLPQTQCRRCGYEGCRPYAEAIASGEAAINRCPPGGDETIATLAATLGVPPLALDPACGREQPPRIAVIDEARCIGCAKCLPPCPVDAIVGAGRHMHTVLADACTGCELCIAPCPVDCISLQALPSRSAVAPSPAMNRLRFDARNARLSERTAARARLIAARKRAVGEPDGGYGSS